MMTLSQRFRMILISFLSVMLFIEPTSAIFSDFRCVGQAQNDREDGLSRAHKRHCVFHNVCHRSGSGDDLLYFEDSRIMSPPKDSAFNEFNYDFYDGKWVTLGAFANLSPYWGPKIVRNEFGINETIYKFDRNASRHVLHQPWSDSNPGHFMETMLAVFALPQILNFEYSRDIQLLDAAPSSIMINNQKMLKLGESHRRELLFSLTNHTPVSLAGLGNVCFETLFVGMGTLSPLQVESYASVVVPSMVETMLQELSAMWSKNTSERRSTINDPFVPKLHKIVVLEKQKSSSANDHFRIHRHGALIKVLTEMFVDTGLAEVVNLRPFGVSWRDQIELIRTATIILSPSGGISFLASFARDEAAVVLIDDNYGSGSTRSIAFAGTDNQWFANLKLHMVYYPVCDMNEDDGNIFIVYPRMYMVLLQTMLMVERSWPISPPNSSSSVPFSEASAIGLYKAGMHSFKSAHANSNYTKQFSTFMSFRGGYKMQPCSINAKSTIPILTREMSEGVWTQVHVRATRIKIKSLDPNSQTLEFQSQLGSKSIVLEESDIIE